MLEIGEMACWNKYVGSYRKKRWSQRFFCRR